MVARLPFGTATDLRRAYEDVDWSATAVGHPDSWPRALRRALELALETRFAIVICWGPDLEMLYNQAYVEMIGDKHPAALGRPVRDVFAEAWDDLAPLFAQARSGEAVWFEDMPVVMDRHGHPEETYFTFSYSPVRDDRGEIAGVMDIAAETTRQVQDHRRLELLTRSATWPRSCSRPPSWPARRSTCCPRPRWTCPPSTCSCPAVPRRCPPPPAPLSPRQVLVEDTADGRLAWVRIPAALGGESRACSPRGSASWCPSTRPTATSCA